MVQRLTSSFDFDDLVLSLQTFLQNNEEFSDVNWNGSAAKTLLRVLAYNTMLNQTQNSFLFNELSFDTTTLRRNIASISSSMLGYMPKSKKAAKYVADVIIKPIDGQPRPSKLVLDRTAKFFGAKDGEGFYFTPTTEYTATYDSDNSQYTFSNVTLVQGEFVNNSFLVSTQYNVESYELPNPDIDIEYMTVGVLDSSLSTTIRNQTKVESMFDLGKDKEVYFLNINRQNKYTIEFGDDRIAKRLKFGNVVVVESLVTKGYSGNNIKDIQAIGGINGYFDVTVNPLQIYSYGGADEEDIESIRKVAPLVFSAQGNAVTASDFVGITKQLFADADSVVSWGGEDNDPVKYGYHFVAVKPYSGEVLDDNQKATLLNILSKRCIGSISPVIVDPDYTYIDLASNVLYNSKNTVLSEQSLRVKVTNAITEFSKNQLEFFNSDFIFSKLVSYINAVDNSILGNVTTVTYNKKFVPLLNTSGNYTINFNGKLKEGSILVEGFTMLDELTTWKYYIYDDGAGNLLMKKVSTLDSSTVKYTSSLGTVDYSTGKVSIVKFNPLGIVDNTSVKVKAEPSNTDPSLYNVKASLIKIRNVVITITDRG